MNTIQFKAFDEERALYNLKNTEVNKCTFAGPADGESALKEARNIVICDCNFSLRYPLWHVIDFKIKKSTISDASRAPIWYSMNGIIENSSISGIKAIRECNNISISNCHIISEEFGWKCNNINIFDSQIDSVYLLFETKNVHIKNIKMQGKYSFQYMDNVIIENSYLDTKDAFWHSKNVTVKNTVVKGEYLAWFSENVTFIDCKIIGTQPLCYCKNLKLINCTMEATDLAFEYSEVDADVVGNILSVKNPKSGKIVADSVGNVIFEDAVMPVEGQVINRS
jgi:hypothetical protein